VFDSTFLFIITIISSLIVVILYLSAENNNSTGPAGRVNIPSKYPIRNPRSPVTPGFNTICFMSYRFFHLLFQSAQIKNRGLIAIFFVGLLLFPSNHWAADQENVAPKRKVVVDQVEKEPAWKTKWDQAREQVAAKNYLQAALSYSELLSIKSNIEEAKWEYLQLLIRLSEWDLASDLIESLIEGNPESVQYRLSGGIITLEKKEYERAAKYFSWVFSRVPNSPDGLTALQGLIHALRGMGRDQKAFPLIEQLYIRKPDDPALLKELATLSIQQGLHGKGAHYLSILIERFPVDDRVIYQAANLYDHMGREDKAIVLWEKYVELHPQYLPYQKKISDYYLARKQPKKALSHLLVLLENGGRSDELLLKIGRTYLDEYKRPDKALLYLQQYMANNPEDVSVQAEIDRIQTVLANDLISIIENNGAWKLWKDLAKLTPDRSAIYLSMVDALERLGKEKELHEILAIILDNEPDNQSALLRLAELKLKHNRVRESIKYFNRVRETEENQKRYILLKAKIDKRLKNELSALTYFERYLQFAPSNREILEECMGLAGRLGLVKQLKNHFNRLQADYGQDPGFLDTEKRYIRLLRMNRFFQESELIYNTIIKKIGDDPKKTAELLFEKAEYLSKVGLFFEAEQIIRRVFISNYRTRDALIRLVELSIRQSDLKSGWAWFSLLRNQQDLSTVNQVTLQEQDPEVILLQAKLLSSEDKDNQAISLLTDLIDLKKQTDKKSLKPVSKKLPRFLIHLYLKTEAYDKALNQAKRLVKHYPYDRDLHIMMSRIHARLKDKEMEISEEFSFSYLVQVAEQGLEFDQNAGELKAISQALQKVKGSVRVRTIQAELLTKQGLTDQAWEVYTQLLSEFPENIYFKNNLLNIELTRGNARQIIHGPLAGSLLYNGTNGQQRGFVSQQKLLLAEACRLVGMDSMALDIYDSMITVPVETQLARKIAGAKISVDLPFPERSFWDIITFSDPGQINMIKTVMAPDFVGKHIGKLINIISTELYAEYRWQQVIRHQKNELRIKMDSAE